MNSVIRSRQLMFVVLCAMVVFVQSLGLVHRVSHGSGVHAGSGAQSQAFAKAETTGLNLNEAGAELLTNLFGAHQDLSKCQSLEHLTSAAPITSPLAAAQAAPHCGQVQFPQLTPGAAGFVAHYRSRAPPHSV